MFLWDRRLQGQFSSKAGVTHLREWMAMREDEALGLLWTPRDCKPNPGPRAILPCNTTVPHPTLPMADTIAKGGGGLHALSLAEMPVTGGRQDAQSGTLRNTGLLGEATCPPAHGGLRFCSIMSGRHCRQRGRHDAVANGCEAANRHQGTLGCLSMTYYFERDAVVLKNLA